MIPPSIPRERATADCFSKPARHHETDAGLVLIVPSLLFCVNRRWTAQIINAVGQTCLLLGILFAG
jgi:hypothetical protein